MIYDTFEFRKRTSDLGITLSEQQLENFVTYYEMLIDKNKVMNLTAITDFNEVIEKHFIDSLSIVKTINIDKDMSVIDIGTGAGFPGIPLKIAFPNIKVTLVDSLNKRVNFLQSVVNELKLNDIKAMHARAEDLARDKDFRENFDICVSRAVANLSTLSEYCLPFVRIGGSFIAYKSGDCENEVDTSKTAVFLLGGKIDNIVKFELGDAGRSLITIRKYQGTSSKYPRKAGIPSKDPL